MKIIFIGDPHAQPNNLSDLEKVFSLVEKTQKKFQAEALVVGGDLFHTHAVIRLEVVNFWQKTILKMSDLFNKVILLVGNHDQIGDKQREGQISSLDTLKMGIENVMIIDKPQNYKEFGFMPYFSDNEEFVEEANKLADLGAKKLFCHQTFDGSEFENGFYAPHGVDQNRLNFTHVISGHIHKCQTIGKVFYPGTPKWDTLSDANEAKGIWTFDGDKWNFVDSSLALEPIRTYKVTPDTDLSSLKLGSKTFVELEGPSTWIGQTSKKLKGKCKIIARPTDSSERKRQAKLTKTIFEYLENYSGITDKKGVRSYLEELCAR
jgi:DNA repair exonuclease SbcCD nuclease subunit